MRGIVAYVVVLALICVEKAASFHATAFSSSRLKRTQPLPRTCKHDGALQIRSQLQQRTVQRQSRLYHSLTLDRAIVPRVKQSGKMGGIMIVLVAILLRGLVRRRVDYDASDYDDDNTRDDNVFVLLKNVIAKFLKSLGSTIKSTLQSIIPQDFPSLPNPFRLFSSRIRESDYIDTAEWNVCTMRKKKPLSGGYYQYSFSLASPRGILDLDVGQEIQMCCVDAMDRVVKEFVFPMTQAKRRGEFDILVQRTGDIGSDRFTRALQMLAVGDELAFKAGRKRLQYNEPSDITSRTDGPIEFVTLVASSLGIAPALKMIRSSVDDAEETTVEEVELLWVNEDDNDFVCNEDISHLESKFDKKIYVSRLTEPELYDTEASLLENDNVLSSISPWEQGRIAMICAPAFLLGKFTDFFVAVGYPTECIMTVETF